MVKHFIGNSNDSHWFCFGLCFMCLTLIWIQNLIFMINNYKTFSGFHFGWNHHFVFHFWQAVKHLLHFCLELKYNFQTLCGSLWLRWLNLADWIKKIMDETSWWEIFCYKCGWTSSPVRWKLNFAGPTWLVRTTWTPMSAVPKKAVKLNHWLTCRTSRDLPTNVFSAALISKTRNLQPLQWGHRMHWWLSAKLQYLQC